jgi:hypothetical protein
MLVFLFHLQQVPTPNTPLFQVRRRSTWTSRHKSHVPTHLCLCKALFSECSALSISIWKTLDLLHNPVKCYPHHEQNPHPDPSSLRIFCASMSLEHFVHYFTLHYLWVQVFPSTWVIGKEGRSTNICRIPQEARMTPVLYPCKDFRNMQEPGRGWLRESSNCPYKA